MSKSQIVVRKLSLVRESVRTLGARSGIQAGNIPPEKMGGPGTGNHAPVFTTIVNNPTNPGSFAESRSASP